MRRIRSIKQAVVEIKENDINTAVSEHLLRTLIKTNAIPVIKSGRRLLIDMDTLEEYLSNPVSTAPEATFQQSRRINV